MSYYDYEELSFEQQRAFCTVDADFDTFISRLPSNIDSGTVTKAYKIARFWHGNQLRESQELYIYHPFALCKKMLFDGFTDHNVLAAALLHDTTAQTDYTIERLGEEMGEDVKGYVELFVKFKAEIGKNEKHALDKLQKRVCTPDLKTRTAFYIVLAEHYLELDGYDHTSGEDTRKLVRKTRELFVPMARMIECNLIANQLEDVCTRLSRPQAYESVRAQMKSYVNTSHDSILASIQYIAALAEGQAEVGKTYSIPCPGKIIKEAHRLRHNVNLDLAKKDSFVYYGIKPYVEVTFKLLEPNEKPLPSQFFRIICASIFHKNFDIICEEDLPHAKRIPYVELLDNHNNKIRFLIYVSNDYERYMNAITECKQTRPNQAIYDPNDKNIRVITRDGDPMDIEKGATVLDFAFILNSKVGSHYERAEVNGKGVEMDYVLQQGDRVVIFKNDTMTARISWFELLETKTAIRRLVSELEKVVEPCC